jgi:hypothetical protein
MQKRHLCCHTHLDTSVSLGWRLDHENSFLSPFFYDPKITACATHTVLKIKPILVSV